MARLQRNVGEAGRTAGPLRGASRQRDEQGFGMIEAMIAIAVLVIVVTSVDWLVLNGFSTTEISKQHSTASAIVSQIDALLESNVPTLTSQSAALSYVADQAQGIAVGNGPGAQATVYHVTTSATPVSGTTVLDVTITVSWTPIVPSLANTTSGQIEVQYQ